MAERLVKTLNLKNGLYLELLDCSRKIAGDRWQIVLKIRIDMPVKMLFSDENNPVGVNVDEIISSMGENVRFEQKRERNFIDSNQKDDILNNLIESFLFNSIDHVSNPDFPKRYILRQYKEQLKRRSWYPESRNDE